MLTMEPKVKNVNRLCLGLGGPVLQVKYKFHICVLEYTNTHPLSIASATLSADT